MPRVSFNSENKVQKTNYNFERLKLETGEKARIHVIEDPVVEYRHSLDAPKVVNGHIETREVPTRDGGSYTDYVREFISSPLCTGDGDTLADNGIDPDGCKMCAYAQEHSDRVKAPQRRYAMHVVRYKTKPGSGEVATPFSVSLPVWSFPDGTFNKIVDFNDEWAEQGGLKHHDLIITCKASTYQNYEYSVAPDAAWEKTPDRKSVVQETYENQQIPDLSIACGSRKEPHWIDDDLKKVSEAWDLVARIEGTAPAEAESYDSKSLEEGISGLMDDDVEETKEEAPAAPKGGSASFADLI